MTNNQLTPENVTRFTQYGVDMMEWPDGAYVKYEDYAALAAGLQECRNFDQAKLINKFYERYPLDTFKGDIERAEALGYYMAGAELQRCGEFIVYEDAYYDE